MKKILLAITFCFPLVGCFEKPLHDVGYYTDHSAERASMLSQCEQNPGDSTIQANCTNAMAAQRKVLFTGDKMPTIK